MGRENQDYYKVAGRSGGPAGPLSQFKRELTQSRAATRRQAQGRHPGRATRQAERQLAEVGEGHEERHQAPSALETGNEGEAERVLMRKKPADEGVAERAAAPWSDRDAAGRPVLPREGHRRLTPLQARAVRLLGPALRVLGDAAEMVDRPIRRTLALLKWLGREARAT